MMTCMKRALLLCLFVAAAVAQVSDISGERMRAHVKFLASDLLEGRGVGARGGDLAAEYIATQFALAGAKPAGDNGTYFQKFTLVGATPQTATQMTAQLSAVGNGKTLSLPCLNNVLGLTLHHHPHV